MAPSFDPTDHKRAHGVLDQLRSTMCTPKIRYSDLNAAEYALKQQRDDFRRKGKSCAILHAYSSVFCNGAHIGRAVSRWYKQ